jgi:hypothetical protein
VSRFATGQLLDENDQPWEGLTVSVEDTVSLFRSPLNDEPAISGSTGHFAVSYPPDEKIGLFGHRKLEVVVRDKVRRELLRHAVDDIDNDTTLDLDDLVIKQADGAGLRVTLMRNKTEFVSKGNALTLLIDKEGYERTIEQFASAQTSLRLTQVTFSIPAEFDEEPSNETPRLVFKFDPPDPTDPIAMGAGTTRPERVLLERAGHDVEVGILMNAYRLPLWLRLFIGAFTFPFGPLITDKVHDKLSDANEVEKYFEDAIEPGVTVREFPQILTSSGVLHTRLLLADDLRATVIGGSYSQSYVDTQAHLIDEPRRGTSTGFPLHDVGFAVEGPAVGHLHEALRLVWNEDIPEAEALPAIQPPAEQTQGGDAIASLQIVRTLTSGRFKKDPALDDGEKGILEAYLRAIANAKDFIYLENQYFTNNAIEEALIEALRANSELQVIAVVNIAPDIWYLFYPFKQRRLITRIRKAVPDPPGGRPRFGVFTRWTHEVATPRPRIIPIYIHSKVAVADNTWATIGSANLDGYSLDSMGLQDFLSHFGMRQARAVEVNTLIFNDAGNPTEAVDLLRRRLWAEHLGFGPAGGPPDPGDPRLLVARKPTEGWLQLWKDRAEEKRLALVNNPANSQAGLAHVLPWPDKDSTFKTPRKHLNALDVKTHRIVPLRGTRPFLFDEGDFEEGKTPEMDYD